MFYPLWNLFYCERSLTDMSNRHHQFMRSSFKYSFSRFFSAAGIWATHQLTAATHQLTTHRLLLLLEFRSIYLFVFLLTIVFLVVIHLFCFLCEPTSDAFEDFHFIKKKKIKCSESEVGCQQFHSWVGIASSCLELAHVLTFFISLSCLHVCIF